MSEHSASVTVTPRALCKAGEHLGLVEFVPSGTLVREKEVALKAGITLKLACKPKLEKVYPAMWVVANTRILKGPMQNTDSDVPPT